MTFLFKIMEDENQTIMMRVDCAKAILPYQHAKVMPKPDPDNPIGQLASVLIQYA